MMSALSATRIDTAFCPLILRLKFFALFLFYLPPWNHLGQQHPAVVILQIPAERQEKITRHDHLALGSLIQFGRLNVHGFSRVTRVFLALDFDKIGAKPLLVLEP
jgi:hypothetical protein